jgi:hypothetical protein
MPDTTVTVTPLYGPGSSFETTVVGIPGPRGPQGTPGPAGEAGVTPDLSNYARKDQANLFNTGQTVDGDLGVTGTVTAGAFAGAGWDAAFAAKAPRFDDPSSLPGFLWRWSSKATAFTSDTSGVTPVSADGASVRRATASGSVVLTTPAAGANAMILRIENGVRVLESVGGQTNRISYIDAGPAVSGYTFYLVYRPRVRTSGNRLLGLGPYNAGVGLGIINFNDLGWQYEWEGGADPANTSYSVPDSTILWKVAAGTWGDPGTGTKKVRMYSDHLLVGESNGGAAGTLTRGETILGDLGAPVDMRYADLIVCNAMHTPDLMRRNISFLKYDYPTLFPNYRTDPMVWWGGASNLSESNSQGVGLSMPNRVLATTTAYTRDYLLTMPGFTINQLLPLIENNVGRLRTTNGRTGKNVYLFNGGGGNDLRTLGDTTAQLLSKWELVADMIRAYDPTAYIIALPILPGDGYTLSKRTDLNAALHANANGKFNAVATYDSDVNIGVDGANLNATYYQGDTRHLNSFGCNYWAGLVRPFVEGGIAA